MRNQRESGDVVVCGVAVSGGALGGVGEDCEDLGEDVREGGGDGGCWVTSMMSMMSMMKMMSMGYDNETRCDARKALTMSKSY